ncbi:MAG: polysaccharide deacetylase family protein [Sarcina sp.]
MNNNKKKRRAPKFYFLMLIVIIISNSFLGCVKLTDYKNNSLRNDYGFINEEKNDEKVIDNTKDTNKEDKENKKTENEKKTEEKPKDNKQSTNKSDFSNMKESAKDYAVSKEDVEKMLNGTYSGNLEGEKIVFLTFDDGPSKNTLQILDILGRYNVHGTFFALGNEVEKNKEYLKNIYEEGNAIGNHTYSHDYKFLYPNNSISVNNYLEEYNKTENIMKSILGENFATNLIRMPGGEMSRRYYKDPNLKSLKDEFNKNQISSIDWNALNGDAENRNYSVNELVENTKKSSVGKNHVVVLMHDTDKKYLTVRALPEIIEYFKGEGYSFKVMG